MVVMDGGHRPRPIELLQENSGFSWTVKLFFVSPVMRMNGVKVKKAEAIMLSQTSNFCIVTVRKNTYFVDSMKSLINCRAPSVVSKVFTLRTLKSRIFSILRNPFIIYQQRADPRKTETYAS